MRKFIPITQTILNTHRGTMFYYATVVRWYTERQVVNFDKEYNTKQVITYIDSNAAKSGYHKVGCAFQSWDKAGMRNFPSTLAINDEVVALMPFETFDKVTEYINTLPMRSRNSTFRLFCYVFFNDAYYYHQFQQPEQTMANNLDMDLKDVCRKMRDMIEKGIIVRLGKYHFGEGFTFSYRHLIPKELLWDKKF